MTRITSSSSVPLISSVATVSSICSNGTASAPFNVNRRSAKRASIRGRLRMLGLPVVHSGFTRSLGSGDDARDLLLLLLGQHALVDLLPGLLLERDAHRGVVLRRLDQRGITRVRRRRRGERLPIGLGALAQRLQLALLAGEYGLDLGLLIRPQVQLMQHHAHLAWAAAMPAMPVVPLRGAAGPG